MKRKIVKQFCQSIFAGLLFVGVFQPVSATEPADSGLTEIEESTDTANDIPQNTEEVFDVPASSTEPGTSSEPVVSEEPLPSESPIPSETPVVTETPVPSTGPVTEDTAGVVVNTWQIDSEVLVFKNDQYTLTLSASSDSPVTRDVVSGQLPSHVLVNTGEAVEVTWDLSSIPEAGITEDGTYVISGTLAEGYTLAEGVKAVEVQVITTGTEVYADTNLDEHVISTVSPAHVKFNLIDFEGNQNNWNSMILNGNHPFYFASSWKMKDEYGPWNHWTADDTHPFFNGSEDGIKYGIYRGILSNTLGDDGYPKLALSDDYTKYKDSLNGTFYQNSVGYAEESLSYLFNPDDTTIKENYRDVYENVQGLVKYDGNGGYVYNSHENYAFFRNKIRICTVLVADDTINYI